jgi:hypothetical protein
MIFIKSKAIFEHKREVKNIIFSCSVNNDDPPTSKIKPLGENLTPKQDELTKDHVILS